MSRLSDDEREYIEQFIQEYRTGYKVFGKATSQEDKDIIIDTLSKMERYELEKSLHQEARARPRLTFEQASRRVKKGWLGPNFRAINQLIIQDDMQRSGGHEDIAAHAFKVALDIVRSRRLILDSEIPRKFKECMEKNTKLETEISRLRKDLKQCQEDFKAYKNRVQPLGNGKTERGGVDEAPPPAQ